MTQERLCYLIALVAHTAKGQTRADKKTPFMVHPCRVAELVKQFSEESRRENFSKASEMEFDAAIGAAYLHDVVEDTSVTLDHLIAWGVNRRTVHLVDLLTKKNAANEAETEEYYQGIAHDDTAALIKAADRCANLEDALEEVNRGNIKRWKNYVDRTKTDVLPIYASLPELRAELETRVKAIEDAIIVARGGDPNGDFDCGLPV